MTSYTNETLRNFGAAYLQQQEEKYVNSLVQEITTQVLAKATSDAFTNNPSFGKPYDPVGASKLRVDMPDRHRKSQHTPFSNEILKINPSYDLKSLIPRVIEKLLETFPQLRIQIDPLNTYMLLDWSA